MSRMATSNASGTAKRPSAEMPRATPAPTAAQARNQGSCAWGLRGDEGAFAVIMSPCRSERTRQSLPRPADRHRVAQSGRLLTHDSSDAAAGGGAQSQQTHETKATEASVSSLWSLPSPGSGIDVGARAARAGHALRPQEWVKLRLSLIHISEPTRLGMISYAVFCLKKKK